MHGLCMTQDQAQWCAEFMGNIRRHLFARVTDRESSLLILLRLLQVHPVHHSSGPGLVAKDLLLKLHGLLV